MTDTTPANPNAWVSPSDHVRKAQDYLYMADLQAAIGVSAETIPRLEALTRLASAHTELARAKRNA